MQSLYINLKSESSYQSKSKNNIPQAIFCRIPLHNDTNVTVQNNSIKIEYSLRSNLLLTAIETGIIHNALQAIKNGA